jgi:hypothetical protein
MKNKYVLLSLLYLSLLLVPIVYAASPPVVKDTRLLPFRTINVDGDPSDWVGILPLVVDNATDANFDSEEIIAVYGAYDDDNLYFWMELKEVGGASANFFSTTTYSFYLDTVPGGDFDNADFKVTYYNGVTTLYKFSDWPEIPCPGLNGAMIGTNIEIALPWDCISGKKCFNCYFKASSLQSPTDYAPDMELGYVLIGCCPEEPTPVGGEILPTNILVLWLISVIATLSMGIIFATRKKTL